MHAGCRAIVETAADAHQERTESLDPTEALAELLIASIPRNEAFRLGMAVWYAYLAQATADPRIEQIIGDASRGTLERAASLLRSAGMPEREAPRLVALGNGLAQSVLIGTLTPDHATSTLRNELSSLWAEKDRSAADAG